MDDQSRPILKHAKPEIQNKLQSRGVSIQPPSREYTSRDSQIESNQRTKNASPLSRLIGRSQAMKELRERISRYAKTEATVLIFGETGTGKELIARILHDLSPRSKEPFVAVNCAAIPGSLAESELFGSTKGAFTSATQFRSGLFSRASRGTLFLDEFGEIAPEVQSKLLRALEFGVYRPIGSNKERRADVRIIAATNRDLEQSVLRREFRADLYYRINVLQIATLPLRACRGDIPHIAASILAELSPDGTNLRIAESVMTQLVQAPWPGNVRELRNVLRRSLVMSSGHIIDRLESGPNQIKTLPQIQRDLNKTIARLIDALTRNKGRLEAVASDLEVSVRTVQRRMKENGLRVKDFRNI